MNRKVHERIKFIRTELGLSQTDFAESLQVARSYITRIESASIAPSSKFIISLCIRHGVSFEWLLTGKGETYIHWTPETLGKMIDSGIIPKGVKALVNVVGLLTEILEANSRILGLLPNIIYALDDKSIQPGDPIVVDVIERVLHRLRAEMSGRSSRTPGLVQQAIYRILDQANEETLRDFCALLASKASRLSPEEKEAIVTDIELLRRFSEGGTLP